jgi:hypothetical protein
MISPYLAHIHITSQTFTISNLPGGFTSGLIRSRITCVTRTDKALLNEPTSHARNIRHIFFEPKVLRSCRRRSIMQCSMRNQCSNLFTCIMDYLHVLYMILMVLSCVLYMTLMMFIYMYYGLFTCTNLVDVMLLFFMVFSFHLPIFDKNRPISDKIHHADFQEKPANFWSSQFSLFLRRLRCVSAEFFFQVSPISFEFFKNR